MILPPRRLALRFSLVGMVAAQLVVVTLKEERPLALVAGAWEASASIPLATNPAERVSRTEVFHAPPIRQSIEEFLNEAGITIYREDRLSFFPDPLLGLGSTITIVRATPILLDHHGSRRYLRTFATTVRDLLKEEQVVLRLPDVVDPGIDAELWWGGRVIVTHVEEGEYIAVEDIRYEVETRENPDMFRDEVQVIREGKRGKREVVVRFRKENEQEVIRAVLAEKILARPVTQIEVRGTQYRPAEGRWQDLINEIAPRYWADPAGMMKILMCESGGNRALLWHVPV
jgi:hypothetical protein